MIGAVELFWVLTAWPNGTMAIVFAAIGVIMFAPRADQAYTSAISFLIGSVLVAMIAATVEFAVLPNMETFAAFSLVLGLVLVPAGAGMAQPWNTATFTAMAANFVPLLAPSNQMSYDPQQFYNGALAIVGGLGAAALSFRLLPPLSPAFRTRRLLALTLRDLRRLRPVQSRGRPSFGRGACTAGFRCCRTRRRRYSAGGSWPRCQRARKSFSFAGSVSGLI